MGSHKSDASVRTHTNYTSGKKRFFSSTVHRSDHLFPVSRCILFQEPLIFAGRAIELQFRMSRPLTDFMATLHKNGIEEKKLSKYVQQAILDDMITFNIR